MNFLAHCALADAPDERSGEVRADLIAGGFLGDFVKGPVPPLPGHLAHGIRLHRRIDAFSNGQPQIRDSVLRFGPRLRRSAPVFVDLVCDHFLARDFEHHHGEPAAVFCREICTLLQRYEPRMPARAQRFYRAMCETNLLAGYADPAVLQRTFERVAQRLGDTDLAPLAMDAVQAHYADLYRDFECYYPVLQAHAARWLQQHVPADEQQP